MWNMNEQEMKFFKIISASALGVLILLLITSIAIAFLTADSYDKSKEKSAYQQTVTYAPAKTEWASLDESRYQAPEQQQQYQTENINDPPCSDPCKVRVEYANKYFMPYPTYHYGSGPYYKSYARNYYPDPRFTHYANNVRFFEHRVIQSDFTY